ncbi:Detected protein of unknown function [Hibiscus syriacus]|uniref:Uncharacterized protein n=1 Tax=Hibiscus syriacus TaxID=106335 RepID=A0A6A3ARB1_HIBSY|nr:Detected protein of unknown function [Hibiscus syriacus]
MAARATTKRASSRSKLGCFSLAAYSKTIIDHLKSLQIPIFPGLTDQEFSSIESTFGFTFPPDLRSILQQGLPVHPSFPNWRSSSPHQLNILLNLPLLSLSNNVRFHNFWSDSWGPKPFNSDEALGLVKKLHKKASSSSCLQKLLCPFHAEQEVGVTFFLLGRLPPYGGLILDGGGGEGRREVVARGISGGWWNRGELVVGERNSRLGACLEEGFWRLREGRWTEDEVRDMMMMVDDGLDLNNGGTRLVVNNEDAAWHVRVLSVLLRGGGVGKMLCTL